MNISRGNEHIGNIFYFEVKEFKNGRCRLTGKRWNACGQERLDGPVVEFSPSEIVGIEVNCSEFEKDEYVLNVYLRFGLQCSASFSEPYTKEEREEAKGSGCFDLYNRKIEAARALANASAEWFRTLRVA